MKTFYLTTSYDGDQLLVSPLSFVAAFAYRDSSSGAKSRVLLGIQGYDGDVLGYDIAETLSTIKSRMDKALAGK